MSDDDYNPYLPDGPGSRMDIKNGPGLADFLPDVSGGYKATAGAPLAGAAGPQIANADNGQGGADGAGQAVAHQTAYRPQR